MIEEIVKIIIISHKRPERVDSYKAVSKSCICVSENQVEEYKKYNPNAEYLVHPDNVVGVPAKIRWIYERYQNIVILDDDFKYLVRNYLGPEDTQERKCTPEEAYEILQVSAFMCRSIKAKYFGFSNSPRPLDYNSHMPIKLTGFIQGGCLGMIDGFQLEIPDRCIGANDYFLSGINAYWNRIAWIDLRYAWYSKEGTFKSTGGVADYRTLETEKEDFYLLKKYFGDAIQKKVETTLRKKLQNYERTFIVPW